MKVGILLDKSEYINNQLIDSFLSFFDYHNDLLIKVEHDEKYNQKYSQIIEDSLKNAISLKIGQIIMLSISTLVIIVEVVYLLLKKRLREIVSTNVLSVIVIFLLIIFFYSVTKLIFSYLLFGTLGIIFLAMFCINLSAIFALIER